MIFLPFGLHAKIYRFPYVTMLIVLAAIYFSAHAIWSYLGFQIDTLDPLLILEKFFVFTNPLQLLTSLFLLASFAIYLELRIGSVLTAVTYLAGGLFGLALKLYFFKSQPVSYSLVSLSTLMGAYFALLGAKNYRALIYIFGQRAKVVYFPSSFLLIASQAFIILSHLFFHNDFPLASLSGYILGAVLGLIWSEAVFVQKGFLYPIEVQMMLKAKKQFDPLKKIDFIIECLKINPTNLQAMEYLFRSIAKAKVAPHFFTDQQKKVLAAQVSGIIKKEIQVDFNLMIYFLSLLPMNWSLKDLGLSDFDERDHDTIERLMDQSQWKLALRLYDVFLMTEKNEVLRNEVNKKINDLLDQLIRNGFKPEEKEWIAYYIHYHPNSPVTDLIRPRVKTKEPPKNKKAG